MGVRLSDCFSLQISCYQNAAVTWISKGGAQSGRAKRSSQLGTSELPPLQALRQSYGVPPLPTACPALSGMPHTASLLWEGQGESEESKARRVCESQCPLHSVTSPASLLSWPCSGDFQLSLLQIFGIWPWRWSQVTLKRTHDSHILSGY